MAYAEANSGGKQQTRSVGNKRGLGGRPTSSMFLHRKEGKQIG